MSISSPIHFRPCTANSTQAHSFCLSPIESIYLTESNSVNLTQIERQISDPYSKTCFKSSFKSKTRPQPNKPTQLDSILLRKDLLQKISPKPRRLSTDSMNQTRDFRCKLINNLMSVCSSVENSKEFHRSIEREKKSLNDWSQKMEKVTEDLIKLSDVKQDYIESLYYYKKSSNEDIIKDILKIKKSKEIALVPNKKKNRRRSNSDYS